MKELTAEESKSIKEWCAKEKTVTLTNGEWSKLTTYLLLSKNHREGDFYTNNTIVLTVAERPELRRRPGETKRAAPGHEQNQEAFNKALEAFRKKWKGV